MNKIEKVAVYCGSSNGINHNYLESAYFLGQLLAQKHISLVYGGGGAGLMGSVAKGCSDLNGKVIGVIPCFLKKNPKFGSGVYETSLIEVDSMHERKSVMSDLADAFIALPGGFGTLDELFEQITLLQLKVHSKPCGFLNVDGYFDDLIKFMENCVENGMIKEDFVKLIQFDDNPKNLLDKIESIDMRINPKY